MEEFIRSRVPWSTEPSLKTKTDEVGIGFDVFIEGLKNNRTDAEMAAEFGVTEKLIAHLRDHFMRFGVGSIMGQD
ncbi:histidine kinase [Desulfotomaculum copahuensis]|uniref:Histidine kinase n=1 Tax=Desulfotomaculum copahuensis TaxID=1838280 RepID=A0A1B7LEP9_9FIRM|nr:histidine kinase [Desulfotomaculum copahuensis]OAT81769.1 histidine kinase [Desulfotomaculum copahuensis]